MSSSSPAKVTLAPQAWLELGPIQKLLRRHRPLSRAHVVAKALVDLGRPDLAKAEVGILAQALERMLASSPDLSALTTLAEEVVNVHDLSGPKRLRWHQNHAHANPTGSGPRRRRKHLVPAGLDAIAANAWAFEAYDVNPQAAWAEAKKQALPKATADGSRWGRRQQRTVAPLPSNSGLKRSYWMFKPGQRLRLEAGGSAEVLAVNVRVNDYPIVDVVTF